MVFFEKMASRGEQATMLKVANATQDLTALQFGRIDLPCHIVSETHHGLWVGSRKADAQLWVGLFRCQGHFWGQALNHKEIERAKRDAASLVAWKMIAMINDRYEIMDLGPMSDGVESLAASLAGVHYSGLDT